MAQTMRLASFGLGFVVIAFRPSPRRVFHRLTPTYNKTLVKNTEE